MQTIHPTSAAEPARRFMPQLDGLRAFAVSAVVIHHLLSEYQLPGGLGIGLVGVQLFFVLSGFLITGLLLEGRDVIDRGGAKPGHVLRRFYVRRTLRIFPLYYGVIVLGLVVGDPGVRESWPYLTTFTYNLRVAWLGYWPDNYAHFWSLCVEEQFYLFWPWAVLYMPRKWLLSCALVLMASSLAYRAFATYAELGGIAFWAVTPANLEALGFGSLISIAAQNASMSDRLTRMTTSGLVIGFAGIVVATYATRFADIAGPSCIVLVFGWLVYRASIGFDGVGRHILEAKPFLYIGKISYGIYVYHVLIPPALSPLLRLMGIAMAPNTFRSFVVYTFVTLVIASLSWTWFEHPINRLKGRFALDA